MSYTFKNKLHFIGKLATPKNQLLQGIDVFSGYELQLLSDFNINPEKIMEESINLIKEHQISIEVLHSPLNEAGNDLLGEVTVEYILNEDMYKVLDNTFRFGESLSRLYNRPIKVVVHYASCFEVNRYQTYAFKEMCERIHNILLKYPNTIMCIENYVPYVYNQVAGSRDNQDSKYRDADRTYAVISKGGFRNDNVKLARYLIETYPDISKQVGVTLDTCHMMISERFTYLVGIDGMCDTPTIEECFKEAGNLCKVVHLNNYIGDGLSKNHHSVRFRERDRRILHSILTYIDDFTPTADITLELIEENYSDVSKDKLKTLHLINNILGIGAFSNR